MKINFFSIGTGLPTSPIAAPPYGNLGPTGSFYAFCFVDPSGAEPGIDTVYVTEDSAHRRYPQVFEVRWFMDSLAGSPSLPKAAHLPLTCPKVRWYCSCR